MALVRQMLRWLIEVRIIRCALVNAPITSVTLTTFLLLRQAGVESFWATFCISVAAQSVNFSFQKKWVFRSVGKDRRTVVFEFLKFFAGVFLLAPLEGAAVDYVEKQREWGDFWNFVVGHVPTFFLRYAWEQAMVFKNGKQK